jgi:hypothetical protein
MLRFFALLPLIFALVTAPVAYACQGSPLAARAAAVAVTTRLGRPKKFHLDKRIPSLRDAAAAGSDDELLTTEQLAELMSVSAIWLKKCRAEGIGPPHQVLGPRCVRYSRGAYRRWLQEREFASTAAFKKSQRRALTKRGEA